MAKKKISKPMQVVALRLTEEERERLQAIADEHHVTLSWVIREGARLYAQDAADYLRERAPRRPSKGEAAEA
jgi:predicted DNA-binding protein